MINKINERITYIWKTMWYIIIIDVVNIKGRNLFKYKCCCWKERLAWCTDVVNCKVKSCWCMMNKMVDDAYRLKHWMAYDRFYHIYHDAKKRCENDKTRSYKDYWLRWIKMEWKTFEDFKNDMYESYIDHINKYWEHNTTIDRIDVNWNYCKNNCRWIWLNEQAANKRNTIRIWWKLLKQIAKDTWLSYSCIYHRVRMWQNVYAPRKTNQFW